MARNAAPEGGALTGIASRWAAKGQKTDFGITREPEDGASGLRGGNVQEHAGQEPNSEIGSATTPDLLMEANLVSERGKSSDFAALVRMRIHGRWRLPKPLFRFLDPCEQMADFRAQQCQHLFEVVSMDFLAVDLQLEEVCL